LALDTITGAVDALQRGEFQTAEQILRTEVRKQPNDAEATALLAVVLDQEKKYTEADPVYLRALSLAPSSPPLLNNYGNHLLTIGHGKQARVQFQKVVALQPAHVNARIQLAQLSLDEKLPAEAMTHLSHLPRDKEHSREVLLLRMQASYQLGRSPEAKVILDELRSSTGIDNADALYDLAVVTAKIGQTDSALEMLGRAARLAPERPDVYELLAQLAAKLGYFEDSRLAWEHYLHLKPADAAAVREHAFIETALAERAATGMNDLQTYLHQNPGDAVGHYELGTAMVLTDPDSAAREFARAIALKPDFPAAHFARGLLENRLGDLNAALPDFESAAHAQPHNAAILDRFGETLLHLNRTSEALPILRRAAQIDSQNSTILLHLGRALDKSGNGNEAKTVFARARALAPVRAVSGQPAGLLEYVTLSPEEQLRRYRMGVERTVQAHPDNAEAQMRYLQLLLDEGQSEQARDVTHKIASLKPDPQIRHQVDKILVAAQEFDLAKQFRAALSDAPRE
jgi:Tfp pilus assembly protein PilF